MPNLLTMGQLIDRTWDHYRARFNELMHVSGWIILLGLLDVVALFFYPKSSLLANAETLSGSEAFGIGLFAFVNMIVAPLFGVWMFVALVRLIRQQMESKRADTKEAMHDGF